MGEPSSIEQHEKPAGVSRRTVVKGIAAVGAGLVVGSPSDTKQVVQKGQECVLSGIIAFCPYI